MIDGDPEMQRIIQDFANVTLEHRMSPPETFLGALSTVLISYAKSRDVPLDAIVDGLVRSWEIVGIRRFN